MPACSEGIKIPPEKRIGIFGGSFDPVHCDHVNACKLFYSAALLSELIVIPAAVSPFKDFVGASGVDRFNMLKAAFKDFDGVVKISDEELSRGGKSYTCDTIARISERAEYKNAELYFLIGEDSALTFHTWKNPREILSRVKIAIVGRGSGELQKSAAFFEQANAEYLTQKPLLLPANGGASSTLVREYLKLGVDPEGLVPESVCEYIKAHKLYLIDDNNYAFLRENSTPARLKHTAGVIFLAREYAKRLGLNEQKAALAALLHDVAKYLDYNNYKDFDIEKIAAEHDEKSVPKPVIHQFLGAYVARHVLKITDEEVLSAIRYHTTGRKNMSALEKVIFVADLLEPSRDYDEVEELRAAVNSDFEKGFLLCVKRIHRYLKRDGAPLFLTDAVYDYYVKEQ